MSNRTSEKQFWRCHECACVNELADGNCRLCRKARRKNEDHPDWGTPNWCSKCSPLNLGYCRCEIACNE